MLSGLYPSLGLDSGWAPIGLMDGYLGLGLGFYWVNRWLFGLEFGFGLWFGFWFWLGLVESILGLFSFHWVRCGFECLVIEAS